MTAGTLSVIMITDEGGNTVGPTADLPIFKMYVQLCTRKIFLKKVEKSEEKGLTTGAAFVIIFLKINEGGNPK